MCISFFCKINFILVYGIEYQKDENSRTNETQKLIREYGQKKHNLLVNILFTILIKKLRKN